MFPCEHCDYKATQKSDLLKHTKSIHDGVKFSCDQCDFKASRKSNLMTHIRATHEFLLFVYSKIQYNYNFDRGAQWIGLIMYQDDDIFKG